MSTEKYDVIADNLNVLGIDQGIFKILKHTASYHQRLIDSLTDSEEASAYLKVALEEYEEDGDSEYFLLALRNVAEARGGHVFTS